MTYKPGDRVRLIRGPRAGTVTEVREGPFGCFCTDRVVGFWSNNAYRLNLPSRIIPGALVTVPGEWLVPYREGDDKAEWTEALRRICGIGSKQKEPV